MTPWPPEAAFADAGTALLLRPTCTHAMASTLAPAQLGKEQRRGNVLSGKTLLPSDRIGHAGRVAHVGRAPASTGLTADCDPSRRERQTAWAARLLSVRPGADALAKGPRGPDPSGPLGESGKWGRSSPTDLGWVSQSQARMYPA